MRLLLFFVLTLCAGSLSGQQLYEENLLSSMPIRNTNYAQLEAYAASQGAPLNYSSPDAYLASVTSRRQVLRTKIGYPPAGLYGNVTARLVMTGEDQVATYYRCWVTIAPSLEAYGLYIVPKSASFPAPLVIAQHGGSGFPELATFQGGGNYHDMVRGAVAQGYIVYAPLDIFYPQVDNDHGSPIPPDVRDKLDTQLRAHGTSLAAIEIAKLAKALDALLQRPEIDPNRVAMIGCSYGGYYTLYTAALEMRIKVAIASCSFSDEKTTPLVTLTDLTAPDLVALVCPRPLQIQSGVFDDIFPLSAARRGFSFASPYYQGLGMGDQLDFEIFQGAHEFRGDIAWAFLRKYL